MLIESCKYLEYIIFYEGFNTSYDHPEFELLWYVFEEICTSRSIQILFVDDYDYFNIFYKGIEYHNLN